MVFFFICSSFFYKYPDIFTIKYIYKHIVCYIYPIYINYKKFFHFDIGMMRVRSDLKHNNKNKKKITHQNVIIYYLFRY